MKITDVKRHHCEKEPLKKTFVIGAESVKERKKNYDFIPYEYFLCLPLNNNAEFIEKTNPHIYRGKSNL